MSCILLASLGDLYDVRKGSPPNLCWYVSVLTNLHPNVNFYYRMMRLSRPIDF